MHSVANLATLQTPLSDFFSLQKTAKHYLVSETRGTAARAQGLAFQAHSSPLSPLSLSSLLRLLCSASGGEEQHFS